MTLFSKLLTFSNDFIFDQCACGIGPFQSASPSLTTVHIELTPECNNQCAGCGNVFRHNQAGSYSQMNNEPLSISKWIKIINKFPSSIHHINITGGEPTLYPFFYEFIQMIDDFNLSFTLFTNARWLEPDAIVNQLVRFRGFSSLLVSLHGKDSISHESFTTSPGSFHETIANIKLAVRSGLAVTLSSIINRFNFDQIKDIYRLGRELGVRQTIFSRYVGTPEDPCSPSQEQIKYALAEIESMRVRGACVRLSVSIPQCFHFSCAVGCGAGISHITIDPWGNVRPCNYAPLICGNMLCESIETILKSEQFKLWQNFIPQTCRTCSAFSICRGGCKAEAMRNHLSKDSLIKSPFEPSIKFTMVPDHFCPMLSNSVNKCSLHAFTSYLNGSMTLKDIGIKHGQEMLDIIGALHNHKVVEFKETNITP
jgi:radical SAM protein with 4Fe4S-binding SPASM domain